MIAILFGGGDLIGSLALKGIESAIHSRHKEWWASEYVFIQLSSFFDFLEYVPHMFIPALIITPVLYRYKDCDFPDFVFLMMVSSFFGRRLYASA